MKWRARAWFRRPLDCQLIEHADLWQEIDRILEIRGPGHDTTQWCKGHGLESHIRQGLTSELDVWGNCGSDYLAGVAARTDCASERTRASKRAQVPKYAIPDTNSEGVVTNVYGVPPASHAGARAVGVATHDPYPARAAPAARPRIVLAIAHALALASAVAVGEGGGCDVVAAAGRSVTGAAGSVTWAAGARAGAAQTTFADTATAAAPALAPSAGCGTGRRGQLPAPVPRRLRGEKGCEGWWRSGKGKGKGGWSVPRDVPWREPIRRGEALLMWGYASNEVTHCVRSPDVTGRRIAIIVRVVRHGAPTHASLDECMRPRVASAPAAAGGAESSPVERRDARRERQGYGAPAAPPPRAPRPRPPAGPPPAGPPPTGPFPPFPQSMLPPPVQQPQPQPPIQFPYQFPTPPFPNPAQLMAGLPQSTWPFSGATPPFPFPIPNAAFQPQVAGAQPSLGGPPHPPPQREPAAGEGPRAGAPTHAPAAAQRQVERLRGTWYLTAASGVVWRVSVPAEGWDYSVTELGGARRRIAKKFTFSLRGTICAAGRELLRFQMDEDAATGQTTCSAVEWEGAEGACVPWVRDQPRGRTASLSPATSASLSASSSSSTSPPRREAEAPRRRRPDAAARVVVNVPPQRRVVAPAAASARAQCAPRAPPRRGDGCRGAPPPRRASAPDQGRPPRAAAAPRRAGGAAAAAAAADGGSDTASDTHTHDDDDSDTGAGSHDGIDADEEVVEEADSTVGSGSDGASGEHPHKRHDDADTVHTDARLRDQRDATHALGTYSRSTRGGAAASPAESRRLSVSDASTFMGWRDGEPVVMLLGGVDSHAPRPRTPRVVAMLRRRQALTTDTKRFG
eukprot:gene19289-biopygen42117